MIRVGIFIALTIQCDKPEMQFIIPVRKKRECDKEIAKEIQLRDRCDEGWTENKGMCYAFSREILRWLDAASACQLYNARLVQIESQEKNDFIASQMAVANINVIWGGGTCRYHPSYWEWIPGRKSMNAYTNWYSGEPNNPEEEQCMEITTGRQYRWNDAPCDSEFRFACEKRATSGG